MDNKKEITEELIDSRLKAKGFSEEVENCEDKVREAVSTHYDLKLTEDWKEGLDFYMYEESTQDGYSVFIAAHDPNRISVNEDVHYYDSDMAETLVDAIRNAHSFSEFYVNELTDDFVIEAMYTLYNDLESKMRDEITKELIDEGYEE